MLVLLLLMRWAAPRLGGGGGSGGRQGGGGVIGCVPSPLLALELVVGLGVVGGGVGSYVVGDGWCDVYVCFSSVAYHMVHMTRAQSVCVSCRVTTVEDIARPF